MIFNLPKKFHRNKYSTRITSKNVLPTDYDFETDAVLLNTGVKVTKNSDGSITLNGNCVATMAVNLCTMGHNQPVLDPTKTYKLACNYLHPDDLYIRAYSYLGPVSGGIGTEFSANNVEYIELYIHLHTGYVYDNLTIYPMLYDYRENDTWESYAADNGVLTKAVHDFSSAVNGTVDFDLTTDRVAVPLTSGQTMMTYTLPYDAYVQIGSRNSLSLILNLTFNGNLRSVITAYSNHSGIADTKGICLKKGTEINISSNQGFNPSHQSVWLFKLK